MEREREKEKEKGKTDKKLTQKAFVTTTKSRFSDKEKPNWSSKKAGSQDGKIKEEKKKRGNSSFSGSFCGVEEIKTE